MGPRVCVENRLWLVTMEIQVFWWWRMMMEKRNSVHKLRHETACICTEHWLTTCHSTKVRSVFNQHFMNRTRNLLVLFCIILIVFFLYRHQTTHIRMGAVAALMMKWRCRTIKKSHCSSISTRSLPFSSCATGQKNRRLIRWGLLFYWRLFFIYILPYNSYSQFQCSAIYQLI